MYSMLVTSYELPAASYELRVASYELPVASCWVRARLRATRGYWRGGQRVRVYCARMTMSRVWVEERCSGVPPSLRTTWVGGASTTMRVVTVAKPAILMRCVTL